MAEVKFNPLNTTVPEVQGTMDEFDEAPTLQTVYSQQITVEEYEEQAATETEKALQALMATLDSNPEMYKKVLKKKKQEDLENAGIFSFLKAKILSTIQGENYTGNAVSDLECLDELNQLKNGMEKAFHYAQEAKGRRFSKRIAARRALRPTNCENTPPRVNPAGTHVKPRVAPPPPPCPPPPMPAKYNSGQTPKRGSTASPLKDRSNVLINTPGSLGKHLLQKKTFTGSSSSLTSVHSELLATNPMKRLKSACTARSPGGTPLKQPRVSQVQNTTTSDADSSFSDSLQRAFINIMQHKFRNVRSPSPERANTTASPYSPVAFSP